MTDRSRAGRAQRSGVVWDALTRRLAPGSDGVDVVDVGGGTGGFAVPLAELGHRVTVVDPSPDALAALERRARDAGVDVRAVQGDAAGLLDVVNSSSAALVLCHGVLEQVDDVTSALSALAQVVHSGGALSILSANRHAVVLSRAISGRFAEARHALDDPHGRWGAGDPLPRRFTEAELVGLLTAAGLEVAEVHGVRGFTDLVPGALVDSDAGAHEALLELEAATADRPEFRAVAAHLHVLASKP